jgi:hypothetical protein
MPRSAPRDVSFSTADLKPVIYTPEALPMFADKQYGESLHQKEKRAKKLKPMEPVWGIGKGGRLGGSATQGFVQTLFSWVIVRGLVGGANCRRNEAQKNEDVGQPQLSHLIPLTVLSLEKRSSSTQTRRTKSSYGSHFFALHALSRYSDILRRMGDICHGSVGVSDVIYPMPHGH